MPLNLVELEWFFGESIEDRFLNSTFPLRKTFFLYGTRKE